MLTKVNKKISKNLFYSYLFAFITGCILFVPILLFNITQLDIIIDQPLTLGLIGVSSISMKFIGGLGLSLTFSMLCVLGFKISSNWTKGNKNRIRIIKLIILIAVFLVFVYGLRILFSGFEITLSEIVLVIPKLSKIEQLISLIFGMYILIFFLYILPILREQFQPFEEDTRTDRIKGKLGNVKFAMWRGYKSRIKKDYGKVYAAEYARYREQIVDIREQLSGVLLPFFMVIWLIFPPIAGIMLVLWLRAFSQNEKPYTMLEKIMFILLVLGTLVFSTYIFLFFDIVEIVVVLMNISSAIGIFTGIISLIWIILTS